MKINDIAKGAVRKYLSFISADDQLLKFKSLFLGQDFHEFCQLLSVQWSG